MSDVSFSPRVLLMDEDEDVRESLERGLSLSGFEVATATDGPGLLQSLAELRPGVVVLNMGVPDLSDLGILNAVRNFDSDLPVCVLVGDLTPCVGHAESRKVGGGSEMIHHDGKEKLP